MSAGFGEFWKAYPVKVGKLAAVRAWQRQHPNVEDVLKALAWQVRSDQWRKGFIPHPTTYLNQGRFLDEPPQAQSEWSAPAIESCPTCGTPGGRCVDVKLCNRRWLDQQKAAARHVDGTNYPSTSYSHKA